MKKINQILQRWPQGTAITSSRLKKQGISRQSVDNYKKSGWIESIGTGAYKRAGSEISWAGGLYALQELEELAVHVGGKTALEFQGVQHYINMSSQQEIILWKTPEVRLPAWFENYKWKAKLEVRSATLLPNSVNALSSKEVQSIVVKISSTERAVLEYLYDIPKHEGFDEANYIMEGLSSLRPAVVQELLEHCKSIKVKRLFLYMAEHHNHAWFKRLDESRIDLGSGKREIVKGGRLNSKYKIVVPELLREDQ